MPKYGFGYTETTPAAFTDEACTLVLSPQEASAAGALLVSAVAVAATDAIDLGGHALLVVFEGESAAPILGDDLRDEPLGSLRRIFRIAVPFGASPFVLHLPALFVNGLGEQPLTIALGRASRADGAPAEARLTLNVLRAPYTAESTRQTFAGYTAR